MHISLRQITVDRLCSHAHRLVVLSMVVLCGVSRFALADVALVPIGNFSHGAEAAAEIVAYDAEHQRLLVINGEQCALDMLDIHDPRSPQLWKRIDLKPHGEMPTSVAAKNGRIAVAICRATGERGNVRASGPRRSIDRRNSSRIPPRYGDVFRRWR